MVVAGMVWVPGCRVVGEGVGSGTTGTVTTGIGASEVVGTGATLLLVSLVEVGGGLWRVGSPVTVSQRVVQPHDSTAPAVPTATPDGTRPLLWKASWAWWFAALAPAARAAATAKKVPFMLRIVMNGSWYLFVYWGI
jgi:hypothetical protein